MRYPIAIVEAGYVEVLDIIKTETLEYKCKAEKCGYISGNHDIAKLLSDENLNRFVAISNSIIFPLKDVDYDLITLFGLDNPIEELGRLMQCWITLGSAVESALQIFLAVYLSDYERSGWHKWEIFNSEEVQNDLVVAINDLKVKGCLNKDQANSLKDLIKKELKTRKSLPKLETVMLFDLIEFYRKEVKLDGESIAKLNMIREYRNCIHAFKARDLGEWEVLLDAMRFFCSLILELQSMMPDADSILSDMMSGMDSYQSDY